MAESETEKAFSSNPFKGKQTVKRLKNVARNVPILGTAFDVADIASSVATGNLGQAAVDTGLALAGTTPVGRALSKTIKKSLNKARSKFKDKFKIDNPDDVYDPTDKKIKSYGQMYADEVKKDTEEKIKKKELKPEQLEDYVNTHGNLYKITGFIKGQEPIPFHPLELINAKGVKGEHKYRDNSPQLFNLKERIKKEGYKPDPIHVIIDERGRPFVMEGNHRLAEAIQSGRNRIDVELQYLRGGENVDGPFSPKNLGLKSEMAKGGAMLNQQMKMAFMQDGGLQDEGGTVDKESGNDVPSGSLKKEVRDDVPAMLSEGEFVIPADVVRYIGLEKLMQMRQEAKMGLQMMEKMGQMGNSEEAEIPDDLPFGVTDIVVMGSDDDDDDEKEMAQGGVIYAQEGTDVPSSRSIPNWVNPPSGDGPVTMALTKLTNPVTGETFTANTGGYSVKSVDEIKRMMGEENTDVSKGVGAVLLPDGTIDNSAMMDMYNRGQQPQQTDFEKMMGYEAGRGDNPYAPSRVAYKNKKGEVVYVLEDYLGRPMESTTGLTRVTPYGPEGDQPTPAPSPDPTPDDGDSAADRRQAERKDDRKKAREAERKASRDAQIDKDIKNLQDSGDPRFVGKTGKEARDAYFDLSFKERAGMAKEDLAGRPAKLKEDLDSLLEKLPKAVKEIPDVINAIGDVYKDAGIELGRKAKVALGLQGEGAVERSSPPPSRPAPPSIPEGLGKETETKTYIDPYESGFGTGPQSNKTKSDFKNIVYDEQGNVVTRPTNKIINPLSVQPANEFSGTGVPRYDDETFDSAKYNVDDTTPQPSLSPSDTGVDSMRMKKTSVNLPDTSYDAFPIRPMDRGLMSREEIREQRAFEAGLATAKNQAIADKKDPLDSAKEKAREKRRKEKRKEDREKKASSARKNLTSKERSGGAKLDKEYGISGLKKGGLMKKDYP